LASLKFWNLLSGEKILIYQEDTIIFKSNIDDFIKWDYIGAPWSTTQNDNMSGVGNGGLSLRTKSIMVKIIKSIGINSTTYNSFTISYIQSTKSTCPPEDVYFTKNMEDLNIGLLADREAALEFSTETICNKDSFGGHCFWINDSTWIKRIYDNIIIQFKPKYDMSMLEHRGGWRSVLNSFVANDLYNRSSNFDFFDVVERFFLWDVNYKCLTKWAGIIHCTQKTPKYLDNINITNLFTNPNFIESLSNCLCIISLSNYVSNFLKTSFDNLGIQVPIYTLKHPVDMENIILFDMTTYEKNKTKKLIQIGQQLRKVTSIYLVNSLDHEKIWLTGTQYLNRCNFLFDNEIKHYKININNFHSSVQMAYTSTIYEYDILLSENIVFIDLYDASANNAVLECIIRNTPIIINKIEAVVEYLGDDYPLYFRSFDDIPNLLTKDKILEAHKYLCKVPKNDLSIDYFTKRLFTIINMTFQNQS
jgi:hypothetical protein